MNKNYEASQLTASEVESSRGPLLLEFGTDWCGICQEAAPLIQAALSDFPTITRIKIEDGPGRPLGRSFRIKLWPTILFIFDGKEIARVVRPQNVEEIREGLKQIQS